MNYRSLALAIAALSSPQITPAAAQVVYVAPGGVYVGSGPVYVIPAPPNGAPPFGPTYGAAPPSSDDPPNVPSHALTKVTMDAATARTTSVRTRPSMCVIA